MLCENCNLPHPGTFATGRFCSRKCSNSFSSKVNREETNKKVSKTLRKHPLVEKICLACQKNFIGKVTRKFCSNRCHCTSNTLGKTWKVKNSSRMGGLRDGGGRTKCLNYSSPAAGQVKLNSQEIRVAKILDALKLMWRRNWIGLPYVTLAGKQKKFYPDFWVEDARCFIEYKGWVTDEMMHKMNSAKFPEGSKLLIVYSNDKRYRDLGLTIDKIEQDPELLTALMTQSYQNL